MSCTPGLCPTAARMQRAISHSLFRNHPISTKCSGCLEHLGFATVEGYRGDQDYPICGDGMEVVLRRERERVTEAAAHNETFLRFLHRLSTPHGGEEGRCLTDECRGSTGAIAEPESGAQADHDTMARLVSRFDPGGTHNENGAEDEALAPPPGSYGDGLHHTHRCTRCRQSYACRVAHGQGDLRVRDIVAMCPRLHPVAETFPLGPRAHSDPIP